MGKKFLRNQVLANINSLDILEHDILSNEITKRFLASTEYKGAHTIGITISRYPEVNTRFIIEAAWSAGKKVAVPKCNTIDRSMDFRTIYAYDDLEVVYMNLLEPIIKNTESVRKVEIDLQVVPGVVFNQEGYRIGYGGGYYDRYMKDFAGKSASLAFEQQVGLNILVEGHDLPVEQIFTPERVIDCRKGLFTK
jgi:5-formyltetrahydrofolate cyclo-ligase